MATCTRCGREAADDARFCPGCGAPLDVPAAADVVEAGTHPAPPAERAAAWGVDGAALRVAATDTVYALGAQLAFLFGVAAFVGLVLLPSGYHGNPVEWARAAVYLAGMSLRAGLTASPEGGDDESFGAAFAVYAVPLIGTMFGLSAVAFVARRREAADPSDGRRVVAARSVLTGGAYFVALAVLSLVWRAAPPYGGDGEDVRVGLGLGSLLVGCLVLVSAAAAAGRAGAIVRRAGRPGLRAALLERAGSWAQSIRAATTAFAVTAAGSALYVYVDGMIAADGVADRLRGTAAFVLLLPNIALLAGGVASGATLGVEGHLGSNFGGDEASFGLGGSVGYGFLAGGVPQRFWPMLAVPVLAALLAGLRAAARAHPAERSAGWYRPAVVLAALWLVGGLASQVNVSSVSSGSLLGVRGSGSVHGRGGLGLPSLLVCAFAFGLLVWAAQRFAAPNVAAAAPRAFARLGGAHEARTRRDDAAAWRREPRRARAVVSLTVAIVALLVAGTAGAASYIRTAGSPERVARAYLDALARGDAAGALAQSTSTERRGADLLTEEALDAQRAAAPIKNVEIVETEIEGEEATVEYRMLVGDTSTRGMLELRKQGGGMIPRWKVTDPGGMVSVDVAGDVNEVRINGAPVAVVGDAAVATVFPGLVVASIPESGIYAAEEARRVLSGPDGHVSVRFELELSAAAEERVKKALDARARECAAVRSLDVPEECPFDDEYGFGEVTDVRWTIVEQPSRTAEVDLRYDGKIEVRGRIALVVTYRENLFFDGPTTKREEVSGTYSATVTFAGDKVLLEFVFTA